MKKGYNLLKSYWSDESGASAIEYGLIAALIGVGIIAGLRAFGDQTQGAWSKMANAVQNGVA